MKVTPEKAERLLKLFLKYRSMNRGVVDPNVSQGCGCRECIEDMRKALEEWDPELSEGDVLRRKLWESLFDEIKKLTPEEREITRRMVKVQIYSEAYLKAHPELLE